MILLSGSTGLVGTNLLKALTAKAEKIRAVYRNEQRIPTELRNNPHIEWIKGDLSDSDFLLEAMENITTIIHTAGLVSFQRKDRKKLYESNNVATASIVNAALEKKIPRFIYLSTVALLYNNTGRLLSENDTTDPKETPIYNYYAYTKYLAELEVHRGKAEGLNTIIIAPSFILGYDKNFQSTALYFKSFLKKLFFYTEGSIGWIDVADLVRTILLIIENPNIKNDKFIVSGTNETYKTVNTIIAREFYPNAFMRPLSKWKMALLAQAEKIQCLFTKETPFLSREMITFAFHKQAFDNKKLLRHFPDFQYTPLTTTLKNICNRYKKDTLL